MTLKEVFDQALTQCTKFQDNQDNARQEFEKAVNNIINTLTIDKKQFDIVRCYIGYGRNNDPRIAMVQNGTAATSYINIPGMTFKLKLERGPKHHSYYEDWYEYRVKAYTNINIDSLNEEASAEFFDTKSLNDLIQYISDTDGIAIDNRNAKEKYDNFANEVTSKHQALIDTLLAAVTEYNTLDDDTRRYINDIVYKQTTLKLSKW